MVEQGMEMRIVSGNLQQHIITSLYHDRVTTGDTVVRVQGELYQCHAAILASASSLMNHLLCDSQVISN